MQLKLKPNKQAFIMVRAFRGIFFTAMVLVGVFVFLKFLIPEVSLVAYLLAIWVVVSLIHLWRYSVIYKKREYVVEGNKFIQKSGGIFSDQETELIVKNITHVKMRVPYVESKLFGTGSIKIEAAGSSDSEIYFASVDNVKELYEQVKQFMQENGFGLKVDELVLKEEPDSLGVFFEVFKNFIIGLLVLGGLYGEAIDDGGGEFINSNLVLIGSLVGVVIFGLIVWQVFVFLDLKRRKYEIYREVILYSEGFLSKNYAFVPIENLSDSSVTQTWVDRVFGLFDMKVSCQGSKHEILFKNLKNGQAMSDTLDRVIDQNRIKVKQERTILADKKNVSVKQRFVSKENLFRNVDYVDEFRMDKQRTILPGLILVVSVIVVAILVALLVTNQVYLAIPILIIMGAVFLADALIKISAKRFMVKKQGVEYVYKFINSERTEFSNDKVTGVIVTRNLIDMWFDTVSIKFWSIGSSSSLDFVNIKKSDTLVPSILAKFGIGQEEEIYEMRSQYTLLESFKKNFFSDIIAILVFLVLSIIAYGFIGGWAIVLFIGILLLSVGGYIYSYYLYNRSYMTFCKNFVFFRKGLLKEKYYYVLYDDIKDILTTRYPFSKEGSVIFNVAGETIVENSQRYGLKSHSNQRITSNSFVIKFIDNIKAKDELIDFIFSTRPSAKQEVQSFVTKIDQGYCPNVLLKTKPGLANYILVPIIIFCIILLTLGMLIAMAPSGTILPLVGIFGGMLLLVWAWLIIVIIRVKLISYVLEDYRVLRKSGIFYREQKSIIFKKIDFISKNQGFDNKMFNNGNVVVNTVGSSGSELVIRYIKNYEEFYNKLKEVYEYKDV